MPYNSWWCVRHGIIRVVSTLLSVCDKMAQHADSLAPKVRGDDGKMKADTSRQDFILQTIKNANISVVRKKGEGQKASDRYTVLDYNESCGTTADKILVVARTAMTVLRVSRALCTKDEFNLLLTKIYSSVAVFHEAGTNVHSLPTTSNANLNNIMHVLVMQNAGTT